MTATRMDRGARNPTYADWWSLTHVVFGAALALVVPPFWALAIMVLWEPLEVLVLSPLLARLGIAFGYESLRNSLMDVVFDVVGVLIGLYLLGPFIDLPFGFA